MVNNFQVDDIIRYNTGSYYFFKVISVDVNSILVNEVGLDGNRFMTISLDDMGYFVKATKAERILYGL